MNDTTTLDTTSNTAACAAAPDKVTVTVLSDFLCPWCYIGETRLAKAAREFGIELVIDWKPFELNPGMPAEGMDRKEYRSAKYGWERSLMMDAQVAATGRYEGLAFDYSNITRAPNTRLAHRLMVFAKRFCKESAFATRVFKAYFEEGRDIGERKVLYSLIGDVGLDPVAADLFLAANGGLDKVVQEETEAHLAGRVGVPLFIIGDTVISGAQPVRVFKEALDKATLPVASDTAGMCDLTTGKCGA